VSAAHRQAAWLSPGHAVTQPWQPLLTQQRAAAANSVYMREVRRGIYVGSVRARVRAPCRLAAAVAWLAAAVTAAAAAKC
jgi:hypothetical protein